MNDRPNILMILTDHFRRDAIGPWTPNLRRLAGGVTHLFNHRNDPRELHNLAGVAGYEAVTADLLGELLTTRIGLSQYTHEKERTRLQRVRRRAW